MEGDEMNTATIIAALIASAVILWIIGEEIYNAGYRQGRQDGYREGVSDGKDRDSKGQP